MAYFWRCAECTWLGTFDDDEAPRCAFVTEDGTHYGPGFRGDPREDPFTYQGTTAAEVAQRVRIDEAS